MTLAASTLPAPARILLGVPEAAVYLTISERSLRRMIAGRKIAYTKIGNLVRFEPEDLDAFVASGRVEPLES